MYKPNTLYRSILSNVAACHMPHMPITEETPEQAATARKVREAVANESVHELRRFMEFHGGDVLRPGLRFHDPLWVGHTEFREFANLVGENLADTWDGDDFDHENAVNSLDRWLANHGFHPATV